MPVNVPSASALQNYLNNTVWGQQANIFFTVTRTDPPPINYDLNRDGILADPSEGSANPAEANAISASAQTSGVDYNIYYINTMEIPQAFTIGNQTWIQDAHANSTVNVTGHEVGHLLGIAYESSDATDIMLSFGSPTNPCDVRRVDWNTVNP